MLQAASIRELPLLAKDVSRAHACSCRGADRQEIVICPIKLRMPLKLLNATPSQRYDDEIHTRQPDPRDRSGRRHRRHRPQPDRNAARQGPQGARPGPAGGRASRRPAPARRRGLQGDLTDLASMHRAIEGCTRIYFAMSVSAVYLEATVNTAAVTRHHGVEAFVNMSQMTVTQMSITETTES